MSGIDFDEVNPSEANMIYLADANFTVANFSNANLSHVYLNDVNFSL
ncbi:MAG: pentapeptide repeat-containing protein [Rivularia sp. (in: cyanobacteria)]